MLKTIFLLTALGAAAETRRLDLRSALELADAQNPSAAIAHLRLLEARAAAREVKSGYGPQINGIVQGAYQTTNLQGVGLIFQGFPARVGPYRTFNLRPQATQTLLDLSLLASIKASQSRSEQFRWDEETAREGIRLAAVQLYLQLFEAQSRAKAAEARIVAADSLLKQARDRESLGGASKLDVARNEQQLYAERYLLTQARRDGKVVADGLKEVLGLPQIDDLDLATPSLAAVEVAEERPEKKALAAEFTTGFLTLKAAQRERLPKLSGFGDFGLLGQGPDKSLSTYVIGATLSFPIFTSGRIASSIEQARLRVKQTEQSQRRLDLQVQREIAEARHEMEAAAQAVQETDSQRRAAATTLELTRLRFEAGLATSTDTTTAQSNLAEADELLIRSRYTKQIAQAKLARANGNVASILP